jgi:hypothetical protein
MNKVMSNQRKKLEIVTQDMEMNEDRIGKIQIKIEKNAEMIFDIFFSIYIRIEIKNKYFFKFLHF